METTLSALLGNVRGARDPPTTAAAPEGGFFGSLMFDRPAWASSVKGSGWRGTNSLFNALNYIITAIQTENRWMQKALDIDHKARPRKCLYVHTGVLRRHLHTILCGLLIIIRVGRGRIRRELVLPLYCDRYVTTLQIPKENKCLTAWTLHCYSNDHSSSTCQLLPNYTVEAADLLIGVDSVVFAGEVLQAACSTISGLMGRCWVLQA